MSSTLPVGLEASVASAADVIGIAELKEEQKQAVCSFICGNDVFISLPTGYGKSICFALLPLVFDRVRDVTGSIVLCISPLTSLMMEQREKFSVRGLSAEFVGELQQDIEAMARVRQGMVQLLYISPESILSNPQWRDMLGLPVYQKNVVALVVDEAHCITMWRDSFRTDYGRLGELRALLPPTVHVMALTATATASSRQKIIDSLRMDNPVIISKTPHKKNIFYSVHPKSTIEELVDSLGDSLQHLRMSMPRTIVFCRRYSECALMYSLFRNVLGSNFTEPPGAPNLVKYRLVDMYTKCTEASIKEDIVGEFSSADGRLRIVIGTIAFGMGLDCPDVRQIIHWGPSHDIESYIQETGRSGRDGFVANVLLFFGSGDSRTSSPLMIDYCNNTSFCRRKLLFHDFDGSSDIRKPCLPCFCCDVCKVTCGCENCAVSKSLISYAFNYV